VRRGLRLRWRAGRLDEAVDDLYAVIVLAVVEIFGAKGVVAKCEGGGNDGSIPVFDLETLLEGEGVGDLGGSLSKGAALTVHASHRVDCPHSLRENGDFGMSAQLTVTQ